MGAHIADLSALQQNNSQQQEQQGQQQRNQQEQHPGTMATLARLKAEADRLRNQGSRKIFVSGGTVQAYRVANEKKELLTREHPLILAVPADFNSTSSSTGSPSAPSTSLQLVEASVGPGLQWSLTSVNHVLRTASKYGEPTYIFAGILDTDPQAFVAVTLRKGTPSDELSHLDSVLSRVAQFHVSERKPTQVPDAGQVLSSLGKGLMSLVLGGGSSSSTKKQQQREQEEREQQQQRRNEAAERAAHLNRAAGGGGVRVAVHGLAVQGDEEDERPSAPGMYASADYHQPSALRSDAAGGWGQRGGGHTAPMGVAGRQQAEDRLSALKAELAREGKPPSAPDVHARPDDTTSSGLYTPGTATSAATNPYTQQQQQQPWERSQPGVLSNPYATGTTTSSSREQAGFRRGAAPAADAPAGHYYPSVPYEEETTGGFGGYDRANDRGYDRGYNRGGAEAPGGEFGAAGPGRVGAGAGGYGWEAEEGGTAKPWGGSGAVAAEIEKQLQEEAEQARLEWERTQREAERAAAARDDGGWGGSARREQGRVAAERERQQQQQQQQVKPPPDWLDVLGRVFGGGPAVAYGYAAPDL